MSDIRSILAMGAILGLGGGALTPEVVRYSYDRPDREIRAVRRRAPEKPRNQFHANPSQQYFDSGKPMSKRARRRARGKGKSK